MNTCLGSLVHARPDSLMNASMPGTHIIVRTMDSRHNRIFPAWSRRSQLRTASDRQRGDLISESRISAIRNSKSRISESYLIEMSLSTVTGTARSGFSRPGGVCPPIT
jgi:hypothetical protein